MNHQSLSRPPLPGSTATPGTLGKSSVYATRIPPHFEGNQGNQGNKSQKKKSLDETLNALLSTPNKMDASPKSVKSPSMHQVLQERGLMKIVEKLPYELRESVVSVLQMAFAASEDIQKDLEFSHHETAVLRSELNKKTHEMATLEKTCEIFRNQIHALEENIESLQDNIESRKRFTNKNRSAMTRLATTNRMLIDALDALENSAVANVVGKPLPASKSQLDVPRTGQLSPISNPRTPKGINHKEYEEKVQRLTMSQNDKLRESLLKIAREHYKSLKNAEHLELKVNELKIALKSQEQLNRNLKSELDEIKAITQVDTTLTVEDKPTDTLATFKAKNFSHIDDRFQNLIDKNLFDPIDGIQQLRKILAHMASAPNSLSLHEMIAHVVSREAVKIFGSDMICLYLVKPGHESTIHKFSSRTSEPMNIELNTTKSIAGETIKSGKVARINSLNKSSYNEEIDGCTGIVTRRLLSLPLYNTQHSLVIGAIQFLNKGQNFEVFTEADEVFGLIFAHQTSLLLTSCVMYDALFYHSQLLRGLLEASTDLYGILPDVTLPTSKALSPGEVIVAIERTARDLLKCPGAKAFLLSDFLNMPNGQLVMLDHNHYNFHNRKNNVKSFNTITASALSGVVGHVISTKERYVIEPFKFDPYLNPSVDLDPLKYSMLTVPIMDLHGNVLGCIQLLIGNRSPRLKQSDDPNDFRLLFPQAAEWLTHQLAPPLRYILSYLDRPALRPASTPSRLTRSSMDAHHRASFFSHSEEVVTQMLSVADQFKDDFNDLKNGSNGEFVSVPFKALRMKSDLRSASGELSAPNSPAIFSTEVPSKEKVKEKEEVTEKPSEAVPAKHAVQGIDPKVHEMLQTQLIEKQQEFENLFEKFSTLEKELNDLSVSKDKSTEKYKKKLQEMESNEYAKQEILRKDYENKMALLQEEIQRHKEEIQSFHEVQENYESNMHFQLEKRLEHESLIADLKAQIQEMEKQRHASMSNDRKESENKIQELTVALSSANTEMERLALENQSLTQRIEEETNLSSQHQSVILSLEQKIDQLQKDLKDKDKLQSILQEQIVRLAGQNISTINSAIEEVKNQKSPPENEKSGPVSDPPTTKPSSSLPPKQEQPTPAAASPNSIPASSAANNGWVQQKDMLGRIYFYNELTGESSWEDPNAPKPATTDSAPQPVMKGDWLQQFDESGNEYWVNQVTGQSEWVLPDDIKDPNDQGDEDEPISVLKQLGSPSIYDTNASQFSATAGDYTIEL